MKNFEWYSSVSKDEMYDLEKVSEMTNIVSPDYGALVVCAFPECESEEVKALKEEVKNWIQNNLETVSIESDGRIISFDGEHYAREMFIENLSQFEKSPVPFSVYAAAFDDDFNEASLWARRSEKESFERVEYIDYDEEFRMEEEGLYRDEDGTIRTKGISKDCWGNYVESFYDSVCVSILKNPETGDYIRLSFISLCTDLDAEEVRVQSTVFQYTERDSYLGTSHGIRPVDKDGNYITFYKDFADFENAVFIQPEDLIEVPDENDILKPEAVAKYKKIQEEKKE